MAEPLPFTLPRRRDSHRRRPDPRPLGNKLHEIMTLSVKDLEAFDVLADMVLERLHSQHEKNAG